MRQGQKGFLAFLIFSTLTCQTSLFALAPKHNLEVFDFESSLDSSTIPSPLDFPNSKTDKITDVSGHEIYTARWLDERLIIQAILKEILESPAKTGEADRFNFSFMNLKERLRLLMLQYGRKEYTLNELGSMLNNSLNRFINQNVLGYNPQAKTFSLKSSLRTMAVWGDDVGFVLSDLQNALLSNNKETVLNVLEKYADATDLEKLFPVEAKYPVRRAATLLNENERSQLSGYLKDLRNSRSPLYHKALVNDLDLQLNPDSIPGFTEIVCSNLKDVPIYDLTPEFSEVAGGLGRVEQYHITRMKNLGANISAFEPRYYKFKRSGKIIDADYSTASYPLTPQGAPIPLIFNFLGQEVNLEVQSCVNNKGIPVLQVYPAKNASDFIKAAFERMYVYGGKGQPSQLQFSALLAKAQWTYIRNVEYEKFKKQGKNWKPAIINTNDAQTLMASVYRLIDYNDAVKSSNFEYAAFLKQFMFSGTTHTYKNRGFFAELDDYGKDRLREIGIPDEFHWIFYTPKLNRNDLDLFLSKDQQGMENKNMANMSSGGLNASDVTKAVAAIHASEVFEFDPSLKALYGITNGDNIPDSSIYFQEYLEQLKKEGKISKEAQYPNLTPEDVKQIKRLAKEKAAHEGNLLGLNPNQMTIGYSGRWVEEKRCSRGFNFIDKDGMRNLSDTNNIIRLVKAGVQVVIFGNVQDNDASKMLGAQALEVQAYIESEKAKDPEIWPGKFIFKPRFTLEEQLRLLPALDIQIQDSDRGTGASEYTESNATANGGLSMGSPYHEGVIQKHGVPINYITHFGNSIVPVDETPKAYLDQMLKVKELFDMGTLFDYQAKSIQLSQILDARHTAAQYLRLWDSYYDTKSPLYYNNKNLPRPMFLGQTAEISYIEPLLKTKGVQNYMDNSPSWEFPVGEGTIQIPMEVNTMTFPNDLRAYVQRTEDGKKYFFTRVPGTSKFNISIPQSIAGTYTINLISGYIKTAYPRNIVIKKPSEIDHNLVKISETDSETTYKLILRKEFGPYLRFTLSGKNLAAWTGNLPEGVKFSIKPLVIDNSNSNKNVVEIRLKNDPQIEDSMSFEFTLPKQTPEDETYISKLVFASRDETGRWRNKGGDNYHVFLFESESVNEIPLQITNYSGRTTDAAA